MPAAIFNGDAVKILKDKLRTKDGTEVSSTEFSYLAGTTSDIQTQLNSKIGVSDVFNVASSSGTFTAVADTTHLVNTSGGAAAVTLPAVTLDRFVRIKDSSGNANTNNIVITPASGTIDGAASHTIDSDYGSVVLVSDGTNWFIL